MLFYRGDLEAALERTVVAVVGSRRCSVYGKQVARRTARELSRSGLVVASGLARGIDGEAHRGALEGPSPTMAVLGCGIDVIYPPEHAELQEEIADSGVIISEYVPGTRPEGYNFPARNRLISGLSLGVVVVEAGERSGTMITVDSALEQGRDVFAVPGEITRATSRGTNRLLREGAMVVTCVADILEGLGLERMKAGPCADESTSSTGGASELILRLLSDEPLHFDELARRTGLATGALQAELLSMELSGAVVQHPGKLFTVP